MSDRLYIGTYTAGESEGIYRAAFDSGELAMEPAAAMENPSYLATAENRLYAVSETNGGAVASYAIDEEGALTETGRQKTRGDAPCHLCVADGMLYAANYTSGSVAAFALDAQGVLAKPARMLLRHAGQGLDPKRQEGPHAHQVSVTPDGAYLAVCDLGLDAVLFYPLAGGLQPAAEYVRTPPGAGPRHAAFRPDGRWYVLGELSCDILSYKGYGEQAHLVQRVSTLREEDAGIASALRLSPDGTRLLASVRGANTLVLYDVDESGHLTLLSHTDTHGDWPRDAAFTPDGQYVLCACERADRITVFAAEEDVLRYVGEAPVPAPTCICFA